MHASAKKNRVSARQAPEHGWKRHARVRVQALESSAAAACRARMARGMQARGKGCGFFFPAAEGEHGTGVVGLFLQTREHNCAGMNGRLERGFLSTILAVGEVAGVMALAAAEGDAPTLEGGVLVREASDVAQGFHANAQVSRTPPVWRVKIRPRAIIVRRVIQGKVG